MEQSMREQLQALVDKWHERGIPSILWVLEELKRIVAEAPPCTCPTLDGIKIVGSSCPVHGFPSCEFASRPAVSMKSGWVCKDSYGLCFSKARPDWVHYGMWVSGTVDERLFNVGWLITDPWETSHQNGGPECIMEVKR